MKFRLCILLVSIIAISYSGYAQISAVTGTVGLINPKIRAQYELGVSKQASLGAELTYYFTYWTGPKMEVFGRYYFEKVSRGFFVQGKLGYGSLKQLDLLYLYTNNAHWNTYGGGAGLGYKIKPARHFIVEGILGVHLYSGPYYTPKTGYDDYFIQNYLKTANTTVWNYTTGLPVWIEIKCGYQYKRHNKPAKVEPLREEEEKVIDESEEKTDDKSTKQADEDKKEKSETNKK